jgi:hypothetical protein
MPAPETCCFIELHLTPRVVGERRFGVKRTVHRQRIQEFTFLTARPKAANPRAILVRDWFVALGRKDKACRWGNKLPCPTMCAPSDIARLAGRRSSSWKDLWCARASARSILCDRETKLTAGALIKPAVTLTKVDAACTILVPRSPAVSARVAELADALDSGSSGRKAVEVRVLSRAPKLKSFQKLFCA